MMMNLARLLSPVLLAAALAACSSGPSRPSGPDPADLAAAQTLVASAPPEGERLSHWLAAERHRIEAERKAAGQRFDDAEKVCWQRFAVNACLREARAERRATRARLRQEDLALNELERQRTTATRLRELDQKQQDAADKDAKDRP